jgi:putative membrane protein insertion efficiency factor
MKYIIIFIVKAYQKVLSPFLGGNCRFYPTCSMYMVEAVQKYGAVKGGWLGLKRIRKCHPFNPGGYDPVP